MTRAELLKKYHYVLDYLDAVNESCMDRDNIRHFVETLIKDIEELETVTDNER